MTNISALEPNRQTTVELWTQMEALGKAAKHAAHRLSMASTDEKNAALQAMAAAIRTSVGAILAANDTDVAAAKQRGISSAFLDRLILDPERIESMAAGIEAIVALEDPVGQTMTEWERPNGLRISRVRVPLGVIGIIYESRPNVTADAGALCLKSGNAVILRGGSESYHSSRAIHECLVTGLREAGLPETAIQIVPTTDRAAVGMMLQDMTDFIDVIVPRGGKSLIERVQTDARVLVLAHLEGLCHVYIDNDADLEMAKAIAVNAKMRRTGICGAAETLLIGKSVAPTHLPAITAELRAAGCEIRGDEAAISIDGAITPATEEDWTTEYLDAIISVRIVNDVEDAIDHIATYGSHHTDTIVTDNESTAEHFLRSVDSAIVLHNASTQYADGGEFGMGAEIGISTGKLHSPGPVGAEQLTTFKYIVRGTGHVRP